MRLFVCPACKLAVFFGNVKCERCEVALGYEPMKNTMVALTDGAPFKYCANHAHDVCNWLLPADSPDSLCRACRHNLIIPDLSQPTNVALWRKMEAAKHRLLYTILRLRLPLFDRTERPDDGLGFQFLAADDPKTQVMTGHAGGLITIALVEADDPEREKRRTRLREPYRTLLGHFRHEVGHWYWDQLVRDTPARADFTTLFGDADADYAEALAQHYANGPRPDWQASLISPYASAHPWEDFAETWAHYFHIVDTIETGGSYRISLTPRVDHDQILSTSLDFDVYDPTLPMQTLTDAWVALASALNSFNRSMGLPDPYPFVLSPKVFEKLGFIHRLVHAPR
jgi:hypothetical protein